MKIDFIIQGPYHPHCITAIPEYKKYGNVILSCYSHDNIPTINDITVIQNPLPDISNVYNRCNIFYQCYTTLNGILQSKADYIIKCRTEEIYGNIKPFVDKVTTCNKLVTGNVAFPRTSVQPFHPSDHLMGGSRHLMRHIFQTCMNYCVDPNMMDPFTWQNCLNFMGPPLAEQLICLSYFNVLDVDLPKKPTIEQQRELMIQYFEVVPVEDMSPVTHTISVPGERRFRTDSEGLYGYPHESIRNISEV